MKMVRLAVELLCRMTLQAHAITGLAQFKAVRVMAVTAGHPGMVHAALQE
jgi:hypothetical protein